jgi:signal transduction histidine kinase
VHGRSETRLAVVAVMVSLALTGLSVWAVHQQGRALQQRELSDLRSRAEAAKNQRRARLVTDLLDSAQQARRAWLSGGVDDVDAWAGSQKAWLLAFVQTPDGTWNTLPRTPFQEPLPDPRESVPIEEPTRPTDLRSTLDYFRQLAGSPDPLTRATALLGSATCEQQLGHPLAAARILAEASTLLRATPELARYALTAEMREIEALLAAGDYQRAEDGLRQLLADLEDDHPGRLGSAEVQQLRELVTVSGLSGDEALSSAIALLQQRAQERESVREAALALLDETAPPPANQIQFKTNSHLTDQPIVAAIQPLADETRLALVSPASRLLDQYWPRDDTLAPWRLVPSGAPRQARILAELGPAFGNALLIPTAAKAATLAAIAQRHFIIVLLTAVGTSSAWALVLWLMFRAITRQRALGRLQSRFIADISHELKTPLALIRLLSETLAEGRVRDPDRMRDYHETITRESERLTALLDNILDMGRIESGRKVYRFASCDVAAVARQAWALFEQQLVNAGFETHLKIADHLPRVRADATALQQVLVNLLQNAYRYSREQKYIRLSVAREENLIVMTVEDHGIGMTSQQLDQLGQSFFRAEDTHVRQQRGTGLGLAIVNHIVTAHHGKLEVHSTPGTGSEFTVWIPIESPNA